MLPFREILGAREHENGVDLELGRVGAQIEYFRAHHIVLATGYHVDIGRLPLLAPKLLAEIDQVEGSPRLSASFESSAPGLYFSGAMSAYTFGPTMRFVSGVEYAARRIAAAIELSAQSRRERAIAAPAIVGMVRP